MSNPLKLENFTRGTLVVFEWSPGGTGDFARENRIRPLGKVVTRDDLPQMATAVGVQLIDDPMWVIDPAVAIAKGKKFTMADATAN